MSTKSTPSGFGVYRTDVSVQQAVNAFRRANLTNALAHLVGLFDNLPNPPQSWGLRKRGKHHAGTNARASRCAGAVVADHAELAGIRQTAAITQTTRRAGRDQTGRARRGSGGCVAR